MQQAFVSVHQRHFLATCCLQYSCKDICTYTISHPGPAYSCDPFPKQVVSVLELCKVYVKLDQPNTAIETYLKSSSVRAHPYLCAYIFSQIILFLFNLQAQTRMIFFLLLYIYIYIYISVVHITSRSKVSTHQLSHTGAAKFTAVTRAYYWGPRASTTCSMTWIKVSNSTRRYVTGL